MGTNSVIFITIIFARHGRKANVKNGTKCGYLHVEMTKSPRTPRSPGKNESDKSASAGKEKRSTSPKAKAEAKAKPKKTKAKGQVAVGGMMMAPMLLLSVLGLNTAYMMPVGGNSSQSMGTMKEHDIAHPCLKLDVPTGDFADGKINVSAYELAATKLFASPHGYMNPLIGTIKNRTLHATQPFGKQSQTTWRSPLTREKPQTVGFRKRS